MAALTQDLNISAVGPCVEVPLKANAADTYYQGGLVFSDASGGVQTVPAAGDRCIGVTNTKQVIAAADDLVNVCIEGHIWMPLANGAAADNEGELIYLDISVDQSDNIADCIPVADITMAANDICIGRLLRVDGSRMLVAIGGSGLTGALGSVDGGT